MNEDIEVKTLSINEQMLLLHLLTTLNQGNCFHPEDRVNYAYEQMIQLKEKGFDFL